MTETVVEITNLHYTYPDGHVALQGVNLRIAAGEAVGLVGPNGAGKSTLLWHLNGLLPEVLPADPAREAAPVRIGGLAICRANLRTIRQQVGLVFEDPDDQLFGATVLDDVAFGPRAQGLTRSAARAQGMAMLQQLGLAGLAESLPHRLSYGERRRVCLAGVLACAPRLLVLDEPSGNLDPRGRRQLIHLLKATNLTQFIATHDLELVLECCQRVVVLDEGRVWAEGPPTVILADSTLLERHGLERPLSLR